MMMRFKTILFVFCVWTYALSAAQPLLEFTPVHEAFVPKFTDPTPLVFISQTPPEPIFENVPPQPYEDVLWIPGYWAYIEAQQDFSWVCGVWRRPPSGHYWIPGGWNHGDEGWIWARGFWSPVPFGKLQYINKEPPASLTDAIDSPPGENYFWANGYWSYSASTQDYSWLSGKWEAVSPDWVFSPASYVWRPSGFVFAPSYWDWPLEERGVAYSCHEEGELTTLEPEVIVNNLFLYYPDYSLFYWHWWHFHPDWVWEDCGCVPPWWHWHHWWFYGYSDSWGLWWWWSHPGDFAPAWLTLDESLEIAPPPNGVVEFFKKNKKAPVHLKHGDKAFIPHGSPGKKALPFPKMPKEKEHSKGKAQLPKHPPSQIKTPLQPPKNRSKPPKDLEKFPTIEHYPVEEETIHYPADSHIPPVPYPTDRPHRRPWNDPQREDRPHYRPEKEHQKEDRPSHKERPDGDGNKGQNINSTKPSRTFPSNDYTPESSKTQGRRDRDTQRGNWDSQRGNKDIQRGDKDIQRGERAIQRSERGSRQHPILEKLKRDDMDSSDDKNMDNRRDRRG